MNPEQIRARLAEIQGTLASIQSGEEGYSEEQLTQINALNDEFEGLQKQLDAAEKIAAVKAKAEQGTGRKSVPAQAAGSQIQVVGARTDRFGGFEGVGNWLMAVKKAGQTGEIDKRLFNTMTEKVGEDGGFLVPEDLSTAILKKLNGDDSLMARANVLQVGGNALTLNVDENAPWNGGIQAYWTGEGNAITASQTKFKQASWRLQKLAALVHATDELLEDATALESYITTNAPEAINYKINGAILSGNGVAKPAGIIGSPFTVTVAKESGQAADTVLARNVIKMFARMLPQSRARAVWLINPAVEEQLYAMKDDAGNFIYLSPGGQLNSSPYGTLLGRPVLPMLGGSPAIGDVGDIIFADMSYYYMIRKASGVKSATSIHLNFDKEITSFRFSLRLDGKVPFQSPITSEFGSHQMSAFVQLEAR